MTYKPKEDSYLLLDIVKKIDLKSIKKALDMGSGSGIQAKTLIDLGVNPKNMTLVDIEPGTIDHLKKKFPNSTVIHSDLFKNVKGKFDLIVFNPPYLPKHKHDTSFATTGGRKGDEVILRFLRQLKKHLTNKGKALLLTSSFTPMHRINKSFKKYKVKLLTKQKLFFEELYVWELSL